MTEHHLEIGVIVARRKIASPWADHAWVPHAVLPAAPATAPWTILSSDGDATLFYAGAAPLILQSAETAHYRQNLASGRPSIWVALQLSGLDDCTLGRVTADPYEGEALTESIGAIVDSVSMPAELAAEIAAFCNTFHVERPFIKRTRDLADPEALAKRPPVKTGQRERGK